MHAFNNFFAFQVVMCESLSCNWPFKGTNGSIIPGKVEVFSCANYLPFAMAQYFFQEEEVKQEVGKQVKEELVEVNQNDKEVAVCGNSKVIMTVALELNHNTGKEEEEKGEARQGDLRQGVRQSRSSCGNAEEQGGEDQQEDGEAWAQERRVCSISFLGRVVVRPPLRTSEGC